MAVVIHGVRRRPVAAVTIFIVLALAATLLGTVLTGQGAASSRHHFSYFQADEELTQTLVDTGDPGFSTGDTIVEEGPAHAITVSDPADNVLTRITVGTVRGETDFSFYLDCTFFLGNGHLIFSGADEFARFVDGRGVDFTIAGGTGAYRRAAGTVHVVASERNGQSGAVITFDILTRQG